MLSAVVSLGWGHSQVAAGKKSKMQAEHFNLSAI